MSEFSDALKIVAKGIKNDPELYYGYQSNIAMSFYDAYRLNPKMYKNREEMHKIANEAAKRFLDMWIEPIEEDV